MIFGLSGSSTQLPFVISPQAKAIRCMALVRLLRGFFLNRCSDYAASFRHTFHDIHELIKLFVFVKAKHLEDL